MKLFSRYLYKRTLSNLVLYLAREPGYLVDGLFWDIDKSVAVKSRRHLALVMYRMLRESNIPVKLVHRWWWFGWHEEEVYK